MDESSKDSHKVHRWLAEGLLWMLAGALWLYFPAPPLLAAAAFTAVAAVSAAMGGVWDVLTLTALSIALGLAAPGLRAALPGGGAASPSAASAAGFWAGALFALSGGTLFGVQYRWRRRQSRWEESLRTLQREHAAVNESLQERERELRHATSRLQAIFQSAPSGIFLVSEDSTIYDLNPRAAEIFGYEMDDLLGKPIDLLLPARYRQQHAQWHREFMQSPESRYMGGNREMFGRRRDGGDIPVEIGLTAMDLDGHKMALAYVHDITSRHKALRALQKERDLLNSIMHTNVIAIMVLSPGGHIILANEYARALFEIDDASRSAQNDQRLPFDAPFWQLAHPDGTLLSPEQQPFHIILRTSQPLQNQEYLLYRKNNEVRHLVVNGALLTDEEDSVAGVVLSFTDISQQKEYEHRLRELEIELRESAARFRLLAENATDIISKMSPHGIFLYVSPACEAILGYTADDLLGKSIYDLVHPDEVVEMVRATQEGQRKNKPYTITHRVRRKDGRYIWLETTNKIIRDNETQAISEIVAVSRDISQRKQTEETLQKAKETAEAINRAKSEFLANMSHEIRTPLNAVIGMTSLLLETDLSLEQQDYIETIRTSGEALLSIINDILDFSKIESGKMELEQQPFNLRECVESALDLVARQASEKGLELAYLIAEHVPETVIGDVTRIHQVLVNLLSNAVKFTQEGEVVVTINSHPQPNKRHEIVFTVKDTGIGIPQERIGHIFNAFSQVDASTTRRFGGSGLGLAISKRLVEMMGGRISVESQEGIGSTFSFTLRMQAASQKQVRRTGTQPLLRNKHVLIVDDNATNRMLLTRQLESWGMLPVTAASGPEALERLRQAERFDMLILDAHMHSAEGGSLVDELNRTTPEETPFIVLTSLGERQTVKGMARYISHLNKPIKSLQLYNALISAVDRSKRPVTRPVQDVFDPEMGQRHPLRILVAEDHLINQKVVLGILEKLGYRADVAANGIEVTEALERQLYDVVLMDVQMPEMDGVQTTQYIRSNLPRKRQPTIIAMTAHALKGDRERYIGTGMDDYISKPIQVAHLKAILQRCKPIKARGTRPLRPFPRQTAPLTISLPGEDEATLPLPSRMREIPPRPEQTAESVWKQIHPPTLEDLQVILGGEKHALVELVAIFLEETPQKFTRLEEMVVEKKFESAQRMAHSIKGLSATFGSNELADICQRLEHACKAEDADTARALARQARECFSATAVELQTWCQSA